MKFAPRYSGCLHKPSLLVLIWHELGDKFVAQLGPGRQVCRPSHAKLGLKDWAIGTKLASSLPIKNCPQRPDLKPFFAPT
jgi:hypothetical protein